MRAIVEEEQPIRCHSEYGTLEKVIVCKPQYMKIIDVINEVQEEYVDENIDPSTAMEQHRNFTNKLIAEGVEVFNLPPHHSRPEQVFTRDIGFTIGDRLFVSEMAADIRKGEENVLSEWLKKESLQYEKLCSHEIEGGDVIIDGKFVYVGLSNRTTMEAVEKLRDRLDGYTVIPIDFDEKYLHLDCVFNVLSPKDALVFPAALDTETLRMLEKSYNLIEVSEEEQFTMGTNVLSIGGKRVFSLPMNKEVNQKMRDFGYRVIEVNFSEIIKSGGSFRCCTLPLRRGM